MTRMHSASWVQTQSDSTSPFSQVPENRIYHARSNLADEARLSTLAEGSPGEPRLSKPFPIQGCSQGHPAVASAEGRVAPAGMTMGPYQCLALSASHEHIDPRLWLTREAL